MSNLSKKFNIAVESLILISLNSSVGPLSSKDICSELNIKLRYTEQIMQAMVKANILKGIRGANGGYILAKERRKIFLNEVYQIIEGLVSSTEDEFNSNLSFITTDLSKGINNKVLSYLSGVNLEELHNKSKEIDIELIRKKKNDFVI